ncbi:MAG: nucleoside phosphorylase [Schleiferiaceae bacterium]|jgi:uridine phosphorylase|nr:nucleoside phosphorylase [Schleiferiaceae bacterium]
MTNNLSVSELILNPDGSVYHLNLLPQDISSTIITVGDPERVSMITDKFDHIRVKKSCREFLTHTGSYQGKEITVISTGIGTDNIDIVLNELDALVNIDLQKREIKADHTSLSIFRVGTSGTIQSAIPIDSILLSRAAVGFDGLLGFYHDKIEQDHPFVMQLREELQNRVPLAYYTNASSKLIELFNDDEIVYGTTLTMPGFYAPQGRAIRFKHPFPDLMRQLAEFSFQNERLTNIEMETAGIYGLAEVLGHEAISVNAILANRMNGEFSTQVEKTVDNAIELTLNTIVKL